MQQNQTTGIVYAAGAYLMWGVLPLYWKLLDQVPSEEILAHRVFWSFIFMMILLAAGRRIGESLREFKKLMRSPKSFFSLAAASLLISINWFVYIWAVNHGHVIEASLGYYINPLVSILLGIIVLKEKLNSWQIISVVSAAAGVLFLTGHYGKFPWIALILALSFGLYGLAKKMIPMDSTMGLTFETLMVTPLAVAYLVLLFVKGEAGFGTASLLNHALLIGAGVATAVPLLYFAKGAKLIPLSMVGILQYIAPTITLILGVFVFHEHFSKVHMLAFSFIWTGSIIFSLAKTKFMMNHQPKLRKSRSLGA
ncbi:EamA family transporter RarD [Bacillus songklensis]|uniref:EamA family transporter RarD n=1 Tax=Bacillus songklensis TaxID=1069116 RepID=A0ABV8AXE8_9BACI